MNGEAVLRVGRHSILSDLRMCATADDYALDDGCRLRSNTVRHMWNRGSQSDCWSHDAQRVQYFKLYWCRKYLTHLCKINGHPAQHLFQHQSCFVYTQAQLAVAGSKHFSRLTDVSMCNTGCTWWNSFEWSMSSTLQSIRSWEKVNLIFLYDFFKYI